MTLMFCIFLLCLILNFYLKREITGGQESIRHNRVTHNAMYVERKDSRLRPKVYTLSRAKHLGLRVPCMSKERRLRLRGVIMSLVSLRHWFHT